MVNLNKPGIEEFPLARSTVFMAILNGDSNSNKITIEDIPYEVMQEFVNCIYDAKHPINVKMAMDLILLSEKVYDYVYIF